MTLTISWNIWRIFSCMCFGELGEWFSNCQFLLKYKDDGKWESIQPRLYLTYKHLFTRLNKFIVTFLAIWSSKIYDFKDLISKCWRTLNRVDLWILISQSNIRRTPQLLLSVCLSVCLSLSLFVFLSLPFSFFLSHFLSNFLSFFLSFFLILVNINAYEHAVSISYVRTIKRIFKHMWTSIPHSISLTHSLTHSFWWVWQLLRIYSCSFYLSLSLSLPPSWKYPYTYIQADVHFNLSLFLSLHTHTHTHTHKCTHLLLLWSASWATITFERFIFQTLNWKI